MLIVLALIAGFFILTWYEAERGVRFFAAQRSRLDQNVERISFAFAHIDFGAFLREEMRHLIVRISHDIAHLSLMVVRAVERLLTRLVRRLRTPRALDTAPRDSAREFVKTLSEFKGQLNATHPEISDIDLK
ncbi:hypothetical protein A3A36_01850 [Candidatus Kaiserbacteria bacterium RIFCSPLOWO2_01_FULL_52_12b]|uniref:Uncharacterized protein n=1 Tax=Candidatus Kaiserbacteria bacterium RIFCSPLOWO2_01_FULL_52_12b TaxID=1798509 RepID=A0A1F6EYC6_9BACT|nr:MAG: hypothetical protein A3A36_01850 [Candidatus Kaiserbacteria bacterium RIFCSPLOWO2_01_FULL_52_12b]